MTNRERYKQTFSVLHASTERKWEAPMKENRKRYITRTTLAAALCCMLLISTGITAYAYGEVILQRLFGWENNAKITVKTGENGETVHEVYLHTDSLTDPVAIEDGALFFIVNHEHLNITDKVSTTKPFHYEYQDEQGNTHYWIVGLNDDSQPGNFGYAEFIRSADGEWMGGYSARVNIEADGSVIEWLQIGKQDIGTPW